MADRRRSKPHSPGAAKSSKNSRHAGQTAVIVKDPVRDSLPDDRQELPRRTEDKPNYQLRLAVSIAEQAADCIFLTDPDGRITFVNPEVERTFGFAAAELIGQMLHDAIHYLYPDGRPFPREECPSLRRVRAGKSARNFEDVFFRKDGSPVFMICSSAPLAVGGKWKGAVLVMHDVSGRKKNEEALAEQRRLLDLSNDAIIVRDSRDRVIYWNHGAEQMYGWPRGEACGQVVHELLQTVFPERLEAIMAALNQNQRWEGEVVQRRRDGERIKVATRWVLDRGRDAAAVVLEANNDVTERQRAEAALRESEERLRLAQAGAGLGIWDLNLKTQELIWSPENYRLYGFELDVPLHSLAAWRQLVHPDDIERVERQRHEAIEQGIGYSSEYRIRHRSGSLRWIASRGKAFYDEHGVPVRMLGVNIDITERKHAEESLRESQAQLAGIVDTAMDAIVCVDRAQRITVFNGAAERMFGCPAAEVIGDKLDRFIPPDLREKHRQSLLAFGAGKATRRRMGELGMLTGLRANGETFPIEASISKLEANGQQVFTVILRDVTARVSALGVLRASEERARAQLAELQAIYASAPVGLCVISPDLRYVSVNQRLAEINGIPAEQHIGKTIREIIPALADSAEPLFKEIIESGQPRLNMEIVGETPAQPGVKRTWTESWMPLKDAEGHITGINVVAEEITERKRLEDQLKQHAKTLEEADRRKDEFIAMLAHELRNPLAPIRNAVEMLGLCQSSDPDFEWGRAVIDQQVNHLARLLDDLLDLSRISGNKLELKKSRILLADVINAALQASRPIIDQRNHHVSVVAPLEPIYLHADTVRLTQVFVNLINNAAKYTPAGGRIGLAVKLNDGAVVLRVIDNGVGISASQMPYVFDMFYQADRSYEQAYGGLGIGLTLVQRLVDMHGGTVEAHSPGANQGSEFVVTLPVMAQAAPQAQDTTTPNLRAGLQRRILVVDDYPNAAESLAKWLRRFGHQVEIAFDGLQGIEAAEKLRPDIILLDIGMPKLNGYQTAERIRREPWGKHMVLVALTGWGQTEDRQRSREAGFDLHLVKPVDHAQLAAFLAKIPSGETEAGSGLE